MVQVEEKEWTEILNGESKARICYGQLVHWPWELSVLQTEKTQAN